MYDGTHTGSPPAGGGPAAPVDDPVDLGVSRNRPVRALLALSRGGWVSPEQVVDLQHGFLVEAMSEATAELGYGQVTVAELTRRAGVSRKTLYDQFSGIEECFLAAQARAHDRTLAAARRGYRGGGATWLDRVRGAVVEVLALFDTEPNLARVCVVQPLAGPPAALAAHRAFAGVLADGLTRQANAAVRPDLARAIVQGGAMLVHEALTDPERPPTPLLAHAGELCFLLTGPFAGRAVAERQLEDPPRAPARETPPPTVAAPVQTRVDRAGEGTRKQILRFLRSNPDATNRDVATTIGASESTACRRLARMSDDGLVAATEHGRRNAWRLTERGRTVLAG